MSTRELYPTPDHWYRADTWADRPATGRDHSTGHPLENVLSRLDGVRKQGTGYQATCPAHDDRKASLSVNVGNDGETVLLKCFARCETRDIVEAVGLQLRDLFPPRAKPEPKLQTVPSPPAKVVARYDYVRDDQLIFQVERLKPKGFRQRRPDGNGGWIYNVQGVERVLYHHDEVVKATGPVYYVEGEKDVDRLRARGLTATTAAGGANGKWLPSYTEALAGLDLVILGDNDDPGRQRVQEIAKRLYGAAASVRVPDLTDAWPEMPEHGDVSDWLEIFTREDFIDFIVEVPEWKPEVPYQYGTEYGRDDGVSGPYSVPHPLSVGYGTVRGDDHTEDVAEALDEDSGYVVEFLADLLTADIPEIDYVVDNLLVAGNSVLWSAREKTGKGLFFVDTAVNVATGHPVLGRAVKPGPVLYVALEENRRVMRDRFRARVGDTIAHPIHIMTGQPFDVTTLNDLERLRRAIERTEARLVVIDTLRETHDRNENNSDEMAPSRLNLNSRRVPRYGRVPRRRCA